MSSQRSAATTRCAQYTWGPTMSRTLPMVQWIVPPKTRNHTHHTQTQTHTRRHMPTRTRTHPKNLEPWLWTKANSSFSVNSPSELWVSLQPRNPLNPFGLLVGFLLTPPPPQNPGALPRARARARAHQHTHHRWKLFLQGGTCKRWINGNSWPQAWSKHVLQQSDPLTAGTGGALCKVGPLWICTCDTLLNFNSQPHLHVLLLPSDMMDNIRFTWDG